MIDQNKVKQFIQNIDYVKADIGVCARNIRELCEQIFSDEQSLIEEISNYEFEKNTNKKNGMMEGLQTLATYYINDLTSLSEELDKYNALFTDIAAARIKIPEYKDEREIVSANLKELISDFEYDYGRLIEGLRVFIEESNKINLESVKDAMENKFSIDEVNSKVKKNLDDMTEQLDEMRNKTEKFAKINTVRR